MTQRRSSDRTLDVDLDAGAVRIRTLKRRVEHWREVPVPPELARDLEMVHYLREASPRRVKEPLWPLPTIVAVLGHADIATTAIYTTAVGVEARGFLAKMWDSR